MGSLNNFLKALWAIIEEIFKKKIDDPVFDPIPDIEVTPISQETPKPDVPDVDPPLPEYLWNTPAEARHSVRLICDEEGLTVQQKNELCATIQCESGFNTHAKNENKLDGRVLSTDWGICQWNDYWHGKEITPEEAVNNPEKAVRLMCAYWKRGQGRLWVCYSKNYYKKYL